MKALASANALFCTSLDGAASISGDFGGKLRKTRLHFANRLVVCLPFYEIQVLRCTLERFRARHSFPQQDAEILESMGNILFLVFGQSHLLWDHLDQRPD